MKEKLAISTIKKLAVSIILLITLTAAIVAGSLAYRYYTTEIRSTEPHPLGLEFRFGLDIAKLNIVTNLK